MCVSRAVFVFPEVTKAKKEKCEERIQEIRVALYALGSPPPRRLSLAPVFRIKKLSPHVFTPCLSPRDFLRLSNCFELLSFITL